MKEINKKNIELSDDTLGSIAGGNDVVGNTFTSVSSQDALKASKDGKPIVYLDPGYYEVNGSIRKFQGGYYLVSK
ncbi:MAG: hypothetical protein RUMPE_00717 [Eubacteriales bacterium SKADARSKE-1]|nr:hypothetical protein [Eubacteriales bacterium SKADARSKE-1]